MNLREYMRTLKDRNFEKCGDLKYNQEDKDMGYRSGLRFLGIDRSEETDAIAEEMIYGRQRKNIAPIIAVARFAQMELFA